VQLQHTRGIYSAWISFWRAGVNGMPHSEGRSGERPSKALDVWTTAIATFARACFSLQSGESQVHDHPPEFMNSTFIWTHPVHLCTTP